MKILLFAPLGSGEHYWGPGISAFRLYKVGISPHEVILLHSSSRQRIYTDVFSKQFFIGNLDKKGIFNKVYSNAKLVIWSIFNAHKYDVFHGISGLNIVFLIALIFRLFNKPVFIKIASQNDGYYNYTIKNILLGLYAFKSVFKNLITGYISISNDISSDLKKFGIKPSKIVNIPNGVDVDRFKKTSQIEKLLIRKKLGLDERLSTICFVGGISERKRTAEFVQAIILLLKSGYNVQSVIVGPNRGLSENLEFINKIIKDAHAGSSILLIGETSEPELFYQASDIFVLPSKGEGLSNALLEAMSSSLSCIVTSVSGSKDLIQHHYNGLITTGTPEDICMCVKTILNNSVLRLDFEEKSRNIICNKYSVNEIMNQHLALFQRFMNK